MKENVEEAIDRLEYVNRAYDYNNYYSRYDLDCIQILLSDYKRVLKENRILKEEKEQAWEEWNNLEQGSYETEQKLKQQIKESQKENEELEEINNELEAEKNEAIRRYNFETIPKQKVKDKIED